METVYQDVRVGTTYAKIYERIAYKFSSTKISTERAGTKKNAPHFGGKVR